MTLPVPILEMDVAQVCNLHCDHCMHYSNYHLKGFVPFAEGGAWLRAWSERVRPLNFTLLGGEPTLNPDLMDYVRLAHQLWPDARRKIFSNGFFLHRHPGLNDLLIATETELHLTLHSDELAYLEKMKPVVDGLLIAQKDKSLKVQYIIADTHWFTTYRGRGRDMRPFTDGKPRQSWVTCYNNFCKTLHRNRLWKCPPIAFLGLAAEKLGLFSVPEWSPYLEYNGIGLDVTDAELQAFFDREEEAICAMCPTGLPETRFLASVLTPGKRDEGAPRTDIRQWIRQQAAGYGGVA